MTRTKPSGDDLAKAIGIVQSRSSVALSKKELMAAIQRRNPDWKLSERRVSKYEQKLMEYQKQRLISEASIPQSENGDDVRVGSNASDASNFARRIQRSIHETLSKRESDKFKSDRPKTPNSPPSKLIEFAQEVDVPRPPKESNLLHQPTDQSFSDDDPGFKVDADHCGTKQTTSPKSSDNLNDYHESNSDEKVFVLENDCVPEKTLTIDNIEVAASVIVNKEFEVVSDVRSFDDISTSNLDDPESFGKDQDIMQDDNDCKKDGLVCEGCVIL